MAFAVSMMFCWILTAGQNTATASWNKAKAFAQSQTWDSTGYYANLGIETLMQSGDTTGQLYAKLSYLVGLTKAVRYRCDEALPYLHRSIDILSANSENDSVLANAYLKAAYCYRDQPTKIAFLEQALTLSITMHDSLEAGKVCLDLGIAHWRTGNIEKMRTLSQQGLEYLQGLDDVENLILRLEFSLGRYYASIANTEAAMYYMERALDKTLEVSPGNPVLFSIAIDYGKLLMEKGRYLEAIEVFEAPILPESEEKSAHRQYAESGLWYEIGNCYSALGQSDRAEYALLKGVESVKPAYGDRHVYMCYPYSELAHFYLDHHDYTKAEQYISRLIELLEQYPVQRHPDYAKLSLRSAEVLLRTGRTDQALERLDSGMEGLGYTRDDPSDYTEVYKYDMLAELFNVRTALVANQYSDNEVSLADYAEQLRGHLEFLDTLQGQKLDPASRMVILEDHYHVFEKSIELEYDRYLLTNNASHLDLAFEICERSKDQLYRQFLLQNRLRSQSLIPQELLDRESELNRELARIEVAMYNTPSKDSARTDQLNKKRLQTQIALDNLIIEMNEPLAYEKKQADKMLEGKGELAINEPDISAIEIFHGSQYDYLFVLTNSNKSVHRVDVGDAISRCYLSLKNYSDEQSWQRVSHEIYTLMSPAFADIPDSTKKLVIIPDGPWSSIPFEALATSAAPAVPDDLLLAKYDISYANSLRSLIQAGRINNKASRDLAAFAPSYGALAVSQTDTSESSVYAELVRSGEYHLPGAAAEAASISELWDGTTYADKQATEEFFRKEAPRYRILHLSMHAILEKDNPNYSRLIFTQGGSTGEDNYLFASELSKMQLNADLAVLSACNTGAGKSIKGEGVMSISRAFQYAGVPSVVHSLWKVPDAATSELMISFYKHLRDGKNKDVALKQAKLDYLSTAMVSEHKHPYFWAGFVAQGSTGAVPFGNNSAVRYLLLVGIALMTILLVGWQRKKRTA